MSDKIKLYEIRIDHDNYGACYTACSLYNDWKGSERCKKDDAVLDGEKHQRALEYLFKGKDE